MSHGRVASQEWIQYQRRNDTFMARNHQRTLSTNEIVGGEPNLKLFLTLQKWAENENINFIRVSFFYLKSLEASQKEEITTKGLHRKKLKYPDSFKISSCPSL